MRRTPLAVAGVMLATGAIAERRDEHIVIGPEQVWIEVDDATERLWIGPNLDERTQVLSGADIQIVYLATDPDSAALLGGRAIVAVMPGTHSCDTLNDPRDYAIISLGPPPATEAPVRTCMELTVSVTDGTLVLEEDPMGEGWFWAWAPGKGFVTRLD